MHCKNGSKRIAETRLNGGGTRLLKERHAATSSSNLYLGCVARHTIRYPLNGYISA